MIETYEVQIGDEEIIIQSLPATRSLVVLATLTKIVGGAAKGIKDVPQSRQEVEDALSTGTLNFGSMIEGVLDRIDPEPFFDFIKKVVRESVVQPQFEGKDAEERFHTWYESRFSRSHADLIFLLQNIFVHNYGDPVEWLGKTLARLTEAGWVQPSAPSEPETSKKQPTQN